MRVYSILRNVDNVPQANFVLVLLQVAPFVVMGLNHFLGLATHVKVAHRQVQVTQNLLNALAILDRFLLVATAKVVRALLIPLVEARRGDLYLAPIALLLVARVLITLPVHVLRAFISIP